MSWYGDAYNWVDKNLWGGYLPGGEDPNDPANSGGEYGGINQGNFQLPGNYIMRNRDAGIGNQAGVDANYWQNQQRNVAGNLAGQMAGRDSLSALQLRQAADQNIANQRSMAASAAPGNAALMNLQAMQGAGRINQGYAGQAAMAGIAERNAAANTLAGLSGQARGQSLGQQESAYGRQLQNAGMVQQGNIAYEGNRTARYGSTLGAPTNSDVLMGQVKGVASLAAMADGGVVTKPTHALIGEAGPEAVIPLAKLPSILEQMQQAVGSKGEVAARTKMTAANPQHPTAAQVGQSFKPAPPPPPPPPLGQSYGPPAPGMGPPAPAGQPQWRASTPGESSLFNAGVDARKNGLNFQGEGGMPKLSTPEWLAFLHGLGVQ